MDILSAVSKIKIVNFRKLVILVTFIKTKKAQHLVYQSVALNF